MTAAVQVVHHLDGQQHREFLPETLHAPAFVINRDQHARPSIMNCLAQLCQLLTISVITRKQNHTTG